MMLDQFLESLSDRHKNQIGIPKCAKCEGPLTIDGFYYPTKDGTICADWSDPERTYYPGVTLAGVLP